MPVVAHSAPVKTHGHYKDQKANLDDNNTVLHRTEELFAVKRIGALVLAFMTVRPTCLLLKAIHSEFC
jgi:hypothetical protein